MAGEIWDGQWVSDRLGVRLDGGDGGPLSEWVGLALRRRSTRAHLLVSHVLGKHIPLDPRRAYGLGLRLGDEAGKVLDGEPAVVIGFAETATGLGHAVADELGAPYLHSTRRPVAGLAPALGFEELHSHAPEHLLLPDDPALLTATGAVVLVDDELSTGRTAINTIRALHRLCPRELYVLAAIVDVRGPADRAQLAAVAEELGVRIAVVHLCGGTVDVPPGVMTRAAELLAAYPPVASERPTHRGEVRVVDPGWPAGLPESGRHGYPVETRRRAEIAARGVAARLGEQVRGERVLVLGCEELIHTPMIIAAALADWTGDGRHVSFCSTTRSPVVAIDEPGYAIRTALSFPAHEQGADGERYLYNVAPAVGAEPCTDIALVVDEDADTPAMWAPGGLVEQLSGVCERLFVVTLPTHRPRR